MDLKYGAKQTKVLSQIEPSDIIIADVTQQKNIVASYYGDTTSVTVVNLADSWKLTVTKAKKLLARSSCTVV